MEISQENSIFNAEIQEIELEIEEVSECIRSTLQADQ